MTWTPLLGSCRYCLQWGKLRGPEACWTCYNATLRHGISRCRGCCRDVPTYRGVCRLCRLVAVGYGVTAPKTDPPAELRLSAWQLSIAIRPTSKSVQRPVQRAADKPADHVAAPPIGQLAMFFAPRDLTRIGRDCQAPMTSPTWPTAVAALSALAEETGWPDRMVSDVTAALRIVLAGHATDEPIAFSQLAVLEPHQLSKARTADVLIQLGLLHIDPWPQFDEWLSGKLDGLPVSIRADVRAWAATMAFGDERTKPRDRSTVCSYVARLVPALGSWGRRYDRLREVTRDDVKSVLDSLAGHARKVTLVALRSLFRFCKRQQRVFQDPTAHLQARVTRPVQQPLPDGQLQAAAAAAKTAEQKLIFALVAIHAARQQGLRQLRLDDLNFPEEQITIAGHTRRLDPLTRRLLLKHLDQRQRRWPRSANRHVFLSQQTAASNKPVSETWLRYRTASFDVRLDKIRMDRHLEEALAHGPDPLHLVSVFGFSSGTAEHYANSARQLMETSLESLDRTEEPT